MTPVQSRNTCIIPNICQRMKKETVGKSPFCWVPDSLPAGFRVRYMPVGGGRKQNTSLLCSDMQRCASWSWVLYLTMRSSGTFTQKSRCLAHQLPRSNFAVVGRQSWRLQPDLFWPGIIQPEYGSWLMAWSVTDMLIIIARTARTMYQGLRNWRNLDWRAIWSMMCHSQQEREQNSCPSA